MHAESAIDFILDSKDLITVGQAAFKILEDGNHPTAKCQSNP